MSSADVRVKAVVRADLRLAGAAVGAWLVSWVCLACPAVVAAVIGALAGVGLGVALALARRPTVAGIALVLLGMLAGAGSTGIRVWARDASPLAALAAEQASASVWLVVTDDPRPVNSPASYGPRALIIRARATRVTARGRTEAIGSQVIVLATDSSWAFLLPSQHVHSSGRLSPPRGGDLTVAVLSARGPPTDVSRPSGLQRAAGRLRTGLRQACRHLPAPERGLLPGLVIGDTTALDPGLADAFRTTGLTHLLAVSGTNCAIVCGAVLLIARRLRAGPRTAALLAGLALVGFVVLVRPSPSVLRAAVMGGLALLALAMGRSRAALPGLCAAVLLLLLVDPALARSAGFALSVLATAGLLLLAPPWRDALRRRLAVGVAEAIAVPAAAQVACAPVIAAISGQLGIVAVPANLLAIPAVAPATLLGVASAVVSPVWPSGAEILARLASLPTAWLVTVAEHGARVPGAAARWPAGAWGGLVLAAVIAIAMVLGRSRAIRHSALTAACVAAVVAVPLRAAAPGWPPAGWLMVVCDVGQGDALVLNAGPGAALVVDAGPEPDLVDGCLRRLHVARVPLLVLTHLHVDHVGGLAGVLHGRPVAAIAMGPLHLPAPAWASVQRQAQARGVPITSVFVGERLTLAGLHIQVLGPAASFSGTRSDPNNSSVVLRVEAGGRIMLLCGDAEIAAQDALLAGGANLHADIIKVPHHGSSFEDPEFLKAVRPNVALVSVGAGNPYGHPSQAILSRLRQMGAQVERTDRDGDIAVVVEQDRLLVVARGSPIRPRVAPGRQQSARAPPPPRQARCGPLSGIGRTSTRCHGTMGVVPTDLLAPLRLVQGDEEFLVARAVAEVIAAARAADADAEIHDLIASEIAPGGLAELVSPSLFGGLRVVVVRAAQDAGKDLTAALLGHAADLADGVTIVVAHAGGARGKALADGMVKAGAAVVSCPRPRRPSERLGFVRDEVRAAGGTIDDSAGQALIEAVGSDLRELASACSQLVSDSGGSIDAATVARSYRGRAEVTGFMVADNALAGDVAGALSSLRWALSLGVDPVPIADAIADGIRTVSRVAAAPRGNAYAIAGDLSMPPWKVERAQRQARGWTAAGLGRAMRSAAALNADVKGNAGDPVYALERAVLGIAGERGAS